LSEIERTERGYSVIRDPWNEYGEQPYADIAIQEERPTHSNVLGPDGLPYKYKQFEFGFNLTAK